VLRIGGNAVDISTIAVVGTVTRVVLVPGIRAARRSDGSITGPTPRPARRAAALIGSDGPPR
jgi:hypothetical protein